MHDYPSSFDDPPSSNQEGAERTQQCCPHWAPGSKTCLLVADGLFLPVEEHIIAYCGAKFYEACPHYQLLGISKTGSSKNDSPAMNRRRSARIPQYHVIRFAEISSDSHSPENRTEESWTIDLSQHGIRFVSYRIIEPETKLSFTLGGRDGTRPTKGSGRVVWSEPLENSPLFHTGIAFS